MTVVVPKRNHPWRQTYLPPDELAAVREGQRAHNLKFITWKKSRGGKALFDKGRGSRTTT